MDNNFVVLKLGDDGNRNLYDLMKQVHAVSGKVTDTSGAPLPGVAVAVKGTAQGTITDSDGLFKMGNVPDNSTLVFSYIGMKTQEVIVDGKSIVNVTLEEEAIGIEEVVAIGYGTQRKSDVTGSISNVKAEDILKGSSFNALDGLRGKTSGVNIFTNTGAPGGTTRVVIRGVGTINSSSNPLYVVDGVVMEDFQYVNPNDIEHIEVLKDASSSAIYGARGANGVILVTTKRGHN